MEKAAAEKDQSLVDVSREELEQLWAEAKRAGRSDS